MARWRRRGRAGLDTIRARALVDVGIVVVVAVFTVFDVAAASNDPRVGDRPADWIAYVLVIIGAVALFWRRRFPIAVLAVVVAALVTYWLRDHGAFLSVLGLPAMFAVAAHADRRREGWAALSVAFVAIMTVASVTLLDRPDEPAFLAGVSMAAFLIGAVVAGVVVRNRERIFVDTERRAAAAEADRLAEAERAVRRERARIAREMHDVVAHSMSVISVQAAAGREIVHVDAAKAAEVFARIEGIGRESLAELRRMLGVLRDGPGEEPTLAPQPRIKELAGLVADSVAAGVRAEVVVHGEPRELPPGLELAVFRIVQEALTNVRKHAGRNAATTVAITYEIDRIVVEVTDDGQGAAAGLAGTGAGHGLIGMRERVEIYGGHLAAGPRDGGGFRVRAVLPTGSPSAASSGRSSVSLGSVGER